jgi:hypothetical protein
VFTWQAMAMRPRLFVFNSVGRLGHNSTGNGGLEGRIDSYLAAIAPEVVV